MEPLTGVFNRRHFHDMFERAMADALEHRQPLTVLMADIDHFKAVNDSHGHLAGDDCLRWIARCIGDELLPHNALIARFGGEEFVAVLPGTGGAEGLYIAQRLCARVQQDSARSGACLPMTVSIGMHATQPGERIAVDDMLHAADGALYAAKAGGRNCVCAHDSLQADAFSAVQRPENANPASRVP